MEPEQYQEVCKWFEKLRDLSGTSLREQLKELDRRSPEIQECVQRMLEGDRHAAQESFLGDVQTENISTISFSDGDERSEYLPASIGPYEVRSLIGMGGMGLVYKAYDPNAHRLAALKIIRTREFSSPEQIIRFRREARAAASLRHPNIVTVYAIGTEQDIDYIAMQYIEGKDLQSVARERPIDELRAARILNLLSDAVGFAHEQGIIHRDIKPANVMLTDDDFPLLMDFGLAKPIRSEEQETRTGQILGTLGFMAPEQISSAKSVGVASDIYGLGATLYFLLAGRAPVTASNPIAMLSAIFERSPDRPEKFTLGLSKSIQDICMRCLEVEPGDRYSSTRQLSEDIQRYLLNEPLASVPDSRIRSVVRVLNKREVSSVLPSANATKWLAGLGFAFHLFVFIITTLDLPSPWLWLSLLTWFASSNIVNYVYHWARFWQLTSMERQSGIIQLGVNTSLLFLFLMHGPTNLAEPSDRFLSIYPPYTLILALALAAHGSFFMGRLLLAAALFFPLSLLTFYLPSWAPLTLSVVGTGILVAMHVVLRRKDA